MTIGDSARAWPGQDRLTDARQRFADGRIAFRGWRRSRPFWGGFLLVIAGLELLSLPLSGVLMHGALKLVIYIGIGGVFGVLIGILLIAAGIMCWVTPPQRVFYGIAGIVLGILSFPASNLGGFFLGMLLAIIGGSLAFAWTHVEAAPGAAAAPGTAARGASGHNALAVATLPALLAVGLLAAPAAAPGAAPGNATQTASGGLCILGICIGGSPSPSPTPTPAPTSSPRPSPSASPQPGSSATPGSSSTRPHPKASRKASRRHRHVKVRHASAGGLSASNSISVLTAGSATLTRFIFDGIVNMPVAGGGTVKMLKFSASSADMSGGVKVSITERGHTLVTDNSTLTTTGGLTLYATKLVGTLTVAGVGLVTLTFTPTTIDKILLKFVNLLTGSVPITMTNVTTDQFLISAANQVWGAPVEGF